MKKVLSLFFTLLILTGALSACGLNDAPETSGQVENSEQLYSVDRKKFTIQSLEEYNRYLETIPEGGKFVTYDALKEIGTFKIFVGLTNTPRDGYTYYVYGLVDETGKEFILYIKHTDEIVNNISNTIECEDPQDMRIAKEKSDGNYSHQGLTYGYWEGRLGYLEWHVDEIQFQLAGVEFSLADYPVGEDTFVSKLLSQETAVAAVESINAKVAMK